MFPDYLSVSYDYGFIDNTRNFYDTTLRNINSLTELSQKLTLLVEEFNLKATVSKQTHFGAIKTFSNETTNGIVVNKTD